MNLARLYSPLARLFVLASMMSACASAPPCPEAAAPLPTASATSVVETPPLLDAAPTPAPPGSFDPEATNYEYPYPVSFFDLKGQQPARMAYVDVAAQGTPKGRTVVLLHGKNFGAFAWAKTIDLLSKAGYRVVAPDQIGFGKSSKPERYQYSFAQLAGNTRALLTSLGVDRSVIVGHSMGGMLATRYALLYPEATERLLLVNPIGLEDYGALIPPRGVEAWYAAELAQTPEAIREYQRKAYYDGAWTVEYEELTTLASGWTKHPDYQRVAWASALTYDMILTQPVVNDFNRLKVPTRLVIGLRDKTALGKTFAKPEVAATMGDYPKLGKAAQKAIPGAELVELKGVGHCPQIEAFDAWSKTLLDFASKK